MILSIRRASNNCSKTALIVFSSTLKPLLMTRTRLSLGLPSSQRGYVLRTGMLLQMKSISKQLRDTKKRQKNSIVALSQKQSMLPHPIRLFLQTKKERIQHVGSTRLRFPQEENCCSTKSRHHLTLWDTQFPNRKSVRS